MTPAAPFIITCPLCSHTDTSDLPAEQVVARCGECGTRIAYGRATSRWVVEPVGDGRFVRITIQRPGEVEPREELVDGMLAAAIAQNVLSVVKLPKV